MAPQLPEQSAPEYSGAEVDLARYSEGIEIIATRALGNREDARDVVQETLARAWAVIRSGQARRYASLGALVYGIARHVIVDAQRARSRTLSLGDAPLNVPAAVPGALDQLVRDEEVQRVRNALTRLSKNEQEILRRCYVDGVRLNEIARELGLPADRIRKRKSRALDRLRQLIGGAESHTNVDAPIKE
jgi:RNA polymerase sigma-70 factor (ECF subfamily)